MKMEQCKETVAVCSKQRVLIEFMTAGNVKNATELEDAYSSNLS
jgi:hypothetical protein